MTPPAILPFATWRPVSYRGDAGAFSQAPLGWVLHVTVSNGSPFGAFQGAVSPNRRFSHLWVAKDGTVEQYAELTTKSWAQAAGNGLYWSVETEGFPSEPLTDAQIATLARIHNALGAGDAVVDAVGGKGIGTHVMGGAAWGGHTCPGPGPRAGQRQAILDKAKALRAPAPTPKPTMPPTSAASDIPPVLTKPTPSPAPKPAPKGLTVRTIDLRNADLVTVKGPGVKPLQRLLGVTADGLAGKNTKAALGAAQDRIFHNADYIFGQQTAEALLAGK